MSGHDEPFLQTLNTLLEHAIRGPRRRKQALQEALDASLQAVCGRRGFLAVVSHETGELEVAYTAGEGWSEENRRLRLLLSNETQHGITGHVAVTGKPYISPDVTRDPYYLKYFDDVCSEIAVPILGGQGRTLGVINVDSEREDAFGPEDVLRLSALAHAAAAALTLDGFQSREAALVEIGKTLASTLEEDAICQKVVDVASTVLQFEDCSVYLLDDQTDHLVLRASCCLFAGRIGKASYYLGEGLTGWVAREAEPVRLEDPAADPRWSPTPQELPDEEAGPYLAVPIISRDKILGVLRVLRRKSQASWFSNRFTDADERLLGAIASQLGTAIENARNFQRLVRSERMAAWGELSARSAHMIGNRSFALKGDLNELKHMVESMNDCPERNEVLLLARSMEQGIQRLEEILREFRDYVMATQVTLAECDINQVVREAVEETFPKRSSVRLRLEPAKRIPPIRCDATRLKRAFSELIENAVSFQPESGELRVSTRLLNQADRVRYRLAHAREYVQVEFADEGPGVPEENKERIFQPFYTSRVKGMGLGLSIVKGIIEAHQGLIREVGTPGDGARFLVFLPANGG